MRDIAVFFCYFKRLFKIMTNLIFKSINWNTLENQKALK